MEIIPLSHENFDKSVKKARDVLAKGGIVLYPTDTLYGLAVDALNRPALEKLRNLKGREKKKPISVVVPSVDHIDQHAEIEATPRFYIKNFLPGALTLVLPGKKHLPEELMLNGKLGVRVPNDPFALALAEAYGNPITATSANRAGIPTQGTPQEILSQFGSMMHEIDLAIDAGPRQGDVGSTVITFIDGEPYIIREGQLSRKDLGL